MEPKMKGSRTNVMYENSKEKNYSNVRSGSSDVKENPNNVEIKTLKLKMPKKVTWTEDTIDNEHMGKKKSKSKLNFYIIINYSSCVFSLLYLSQAGVKP